MIEKANLREKTFLELILYIVEQSARCDKELWASVV